ncbi:MAG: DUF5131 family protein [Thermoproteota archaeon]
MSGANSLFGEITYSWNPIVGCLHNCVYCWSRRYATRLASKGIEPYKSRGFSPTLVPERLKQRLPEGRIIFVSDMGDMWGSWVSRDWIEKILRIVRSKPRSRFLFLTKNPARYLEFISEFGNNVILGATIETNRDYGLSRAPPPKERYKAMLRLEWKWKALVIEPILDFDDDFIDWVRRIKPCMIYVGYDNYGNKLPEPSLFKTERLLRKVAGIAELKLGTIRRAWYEKE